ncbi:related to Autophagy-related protein 17 [Saccharomycodes ludwigii]|uniref:Autophagy-related protein 17 n=1 Tax=Saccharomycodes ludwigii TaxID=36035 RepID=A0A376B3Z0_9ASCO|nr:hypothetical protein SCDLUD_004307 [Saccharomycodes ludwigii]KAH3899990.1 hypothetical protein SCDLUD_004307 [Saccharomycodes ludwigii]SSD59371.1 related to Autophagy-related protein 17 [Saccharomycodes ludwigii]
MKTKEELLNNATSILLRSQALCGDANNTLNQVKHKLNEWDKSYNKHTFALNCITNQCKLLETTILKIEVGSKLIETKWKKEVFQKLFSDLIEWQNELNLKFKKLQDTPYTLGKKNFETSENTIPKSNGKKTLADFVSVENLEVLQKRLADIPVLKQQVNLIEGKYKFILNKVSKNLKSEKLENLTTLIDVQYSEENLASIQKFSDNIEAVELDLTNFLNSITSHFDKCNMLLKDDTLYSVVADDDLKLDSIFGSLNEIINDVFQISDDVTNFFIEKGINKRKGEIKTSMSNIVDEFIKFESHLNIFIGLSDIVDQYKSDCSIELDSIKELCSYYEKFISSYHSLLQEVERRREVAIQMEKIMTACKEKLQLLNEQDSQARRLFLQENGDYLPENIWPNGISDLDPLYTINFSVKKE